MGADTLFDRDADLVAELGESAVDVVLDLAAGEKWPALPIVLKRFGRYVVGRAIAGPIVEFDTRKLYLKDQVYYGVTFKEDALSENLVTYIEEGEIGPPIVSTTYSLSDIARAQEDFLAKQYVSELVVIPSQD